MRQSDIVAGRTYRTWSDHFKKWWYRQVISIHPYWVDPTKMDVTFIQYYGAKDTLGQWCRVTCRLTSFAKWATEEAELPPELQTPV